MERKLFRSGGGWGLFLNQTILKLIKVDPQKDLVEYEVENDVLKIKKAQRTIAELEAETQETAEEQE